MDSKLHELVAKYDLVTIEDKKNAIKEIMQEIVLVGLYKSRFFEKAAFYGGTALRIFYGLDRFSEDLDFSLIEKDNNFNFEEYLPSIEDVAKKYGLTVEINSKEKIEASDIKSAFMKSNTIENITLFFCDEDAIHINHNERIKIKFEVDITPPLATYETKFRLSPEPYSIRLFDKESLFSGKLHAVICRSWKSRVKGRDLYDFIFYLQKGIKFNLKHLQERLIDSGYISREENFNLELVKKILIDRFEKIDFEEAKNDVMPFIKDKSILNLWCKEFFVSITDNLDCI